MIRSDVDLFHHPDCKLLFDDRKAEGIRFFKKHGVFPPHHLIVVRESLLEQHPWIATSLFEAFELAKKQWMEPVYNRLSSNNRTLSVLVFGRDDLEQQRKIFGDDPFPYGIRANAKAIDMMQTFEVEQGLVARKQPLEELCALAGLTAAEVNRCQLLATIPASPEYSSLNLAAAVQVFAYELRVAALGIAVGGAKPRTRATHEEIERFYEQLERAMVEHGFLNPEHPKKLMPRMRRLFGRAQLEKEEVKNLFAAQLPAFTDRQRLYKDIFDMPPAPDLQELSAMRMRNALDTGYNVVSLSGHGWWGGCCGLDVGYVPLLINGAAGGFELLRPEAPPIEARRGVGVGHLGDGRAAEAAHTGGGSRQSDGAPGITASALQP